MLDHMIHCDYCGAIPGTTPLDRLVVLRGLGEFFSAQTCAEFSDKVATATLGLLLVDLRAKAKKEGAR